MINWELLRPANIAVIGLFTVIWLLLIQWLAKMVTPQQSS